MNNHQGSCLCGSNTFQISGSFESFYLCHCKHCQKDTGSAFAANLFSTTATINWTCTRETIQTFNLPETRHSRSFCTECGSALPSLQLDGKLLVVPAGSLDTSVNISPNAHIFCASRSDWENELESIKRYEHYPL